MTPGGDVLNVLTGFNTSVFVISEHSRAFHLVSRFPIKDIYLFMNCLAGLFVGRRMVHGFLLQHLADVTNIITF